MAIFSAEMLTRERGELLGCRADELVVGSSARAALGDPFGDPALATPLPAGDPDRKCHTLPVSTQDKCRAELVSAARCRFAGICY